MATARLVNPRAIEQGTAWTVDTWPPKDGPFEGPLDRDWDDFRVTSYGATYHWRTPADRAAQANEDWYDEDDDAFLSEAAEALELPRWARVWRHGEGGPGSGFTAAAIVLAKGKTLDDLAAWLTERAARGGASSRRGTR